MSTIELDAPLQLDEPKAPERIREPKAPKRSRKPRFHLPIDITRVDRLLLALIVVGAGTLSTTNLLGAPGFQDDEGTYTAQAAAVQNGDLAPYTYWYDHPPFGWIQLAILGWIPKLLGLGGDTEIGTMRFVIALYFVADAVLIYLIARRISAAPPFALLASTLFSLSPLSLGVGRQVYLDTVAMPWLLLAFFLALSPRLAMWHHAAAGTAFAMAVLSKIPSAVMGPALLIAMIDRRAWRGRTFSIVSFLTIGALVIAVFPLMALLRGELFTGAGHVSLQDGLLYQFTSRAGSGFLWEEGSGRHNLVMSWFQSDGFLVVAGALAALICLSRQRTRWIFVAVVSFFAPVAIGQGYLPAMYIIGGIPFLCLAIGLGTDLIFRGANTQVRKYLPRARRASPFVIGTVIALALSPIPLHSWVEKDSVLLATDQNADWNSTREWVIANVPKDDVVLSPYSMWQDLNSAGWNDPWTMIVLEKVDLDDATFITEHPGGWREIEWIIDGPSVEPNIGYLNLTVAKSAFENSEVVQTFGDWNVRKVHPEMADQQ